MTGGRGRQAVEVGATAAPIDGKWRCCWRAEIELVELNHGLASDGGAVAAEAVVRARLVTERAGMRDFPQGVW